VADKENLIFDGKKTISFLGSPSGIHWVDSRLTGCRLEITCKPIESVFRIS